MFAPGLFTGDVIRLVGEPAVMLTGCILMIAHSVIALSGAGRWHFGAALMFSGVGWNFMFVSGSSLLVAALPDKPQAAENPIVKANHDEGPAGGDEKRKGQVRNPEVEANRGPARRLQMQGASEFLVRTISVVAALTSGLLLDVSGWTLVHIVGLVPAAMTFGIVCWFAVRTGSCCRRYIAPASAENQNNP